MRNLRTFSCLLLLIAALLAASAVAQSDHPQAPNELPSAVSAARCQYTSSDNACPGVSASARDANHDTLAQLPRRGPGPPFRLRGPMGRPGYPGMWQPQPNPRHALIGAVIGGLLGWAVAAKGNAGARATLGIATVGAALGAGIGASVPSFPSRSPYWRRWPDDDDDEASGRKWAKPGQITPDSVQQTASADATLSGALPETGDAPAPKTAAP